MCNKYSYIIVNCTYYTIVYYILLENNIAYIGNTALIFNTYIITYGMTYHYSLPTYILKDIQQIYEFIS